MYSRGRSAERACRAFLFRAARIPGKQYRAAWEVNTIGRTERVNPADCAVKKGKERDMNIQQMNAAWAQQRRASTLAAFARMAAEAMKLKSESAAEEQTTEEPKTEETPMEEVPADEVPVEEPKTDEPAPEEAADEDPVQDPPAEENPAE